MFQTIVMGAAAVNFVLIACFVGSNRAYLTLIFQVVPMVIALLLAVFSIGRFMGWPV